MGVGFKSPFAHRCEVSGHRLQMSRDIDYTPGLRTGGVLFFRLVAAGGVDGELREDLAGAVLDGGDVHWGHNDCWTVTDRGAIRGVPLRRHDVRGPDTPWGRTEPQAPQETTFSASAPAPKDVALWLQNQLAKKGHQLDENEPLLET